MEQMKLDKLYSNQEYVGSKFGTKKSGTHGSKL
jgi:hypothetical protein